MKFLTYSNIATLAAVILALGTASRSLPGQTTAKPATPAPPAASSSTDQNCANLDIETEQITNALRNMRLEEKVAGLYTQLSKEEAVMSSPEFAKLRNLSARLEGKEGEIEAKAQEMAGRAQELVSEWQDRLQTKSNVFVSSDEGSGWLGVEIDEVTPERAKDMKLPATRGVIVSDVEPDSPAAKSGLKERDVILQYDGQMVEGTVQFRRLVRETPPGRMVDLVISRDGRTQNLSVELADRNAFYEKQMQGRMRDFGKPFALATPNLNFNMPDMFFMDSRTPLLGINAEDLTGQLGGYFGAPDNSGVLVREVRSGTPADKAGLKAGDVIIKVDGKAVKSLSELREQLRDKSDQKTVNLGVLRKGSELNVPVEIEKPKPIEKTQTIHRAQL
jgi:serine protease Do